MSTMLNNVIFEKVKRRASLKCEVYRRGIDTLRFNFGRKFNAYLFNEMFKGLSANSPQRYGYDFLGYPVNLIYSMANGKRILTLTTEEGDVIMMIENQLVTSIDSGYVPWVFEFKGAFFYTEGVKDMFNKFINLFGLVMTVGRCDLCMDVSASTNQVIDHCVTKAVFSSEFNDRDKIETKYLGRKSHNQRHFIRVYDKRLDSQDKKKFKYFMNYLKLPVVTRIELQINSLSCKRYGVTPKNILELYNASVSEIDNCYLWSNVMRECCFNYYQTCFELECVPVICEKVYTGEISDDGEVIDRIRYLKRFINHADKLHEMGFDVVKMLQKRYKKL